MFMKDGGSLPVILSSIGAARPHPECSNKPWLVLLSCRKKTCSDYSIFCWWRNL